MAMVSMNVQESPEIAQSCSGLTLYLNSEQTKALGIEKLPAVDSVVILKAKACVKRTMTEDNGEGPEKYITLEISDMEIGKFSSGMGDSGAALYGSNS